MKRSATIWTILGLGMLILSGIIGDYIFYPHPSEWSFRILSNYAATGAIFIIAGVCWNTDK